MNGKEIHMDILWHAWDVVHGDKMLGIKWGQVKQFNGKARKMHHSVQERSHGS